MNEFRVWEFEDLALPAFVTVEKWSLSLRGSNNSYGVFKYYSKKEESQLVDQVISPDIEDNLPLYSDEHPHPLPNKGDEPERLALQAQMISEFKSQKSNPKGAEYGD